MVSDEIHVPQEAALLIEKNSSTPYSWCGFSVESLVSLLILR
ncbi:hypothetical protein [Nostoc sp.]